MQPNIINISVDTLNDTLAIVSEPYERVEAFLNRSKYEGENHTLAARDEVTLYRTYPKQSGNFLGVGKSAVKFTLDVSVPGVDATTDVKSAVIAEVSFSVPVGVDPATTLLIRQRIMGLLDLDAVMAPLNDRLIV